MNSLKSLGRLLALILRHPLHAGQRGWAIGNWLRWQLGTLLLRRRVVVPWVDGVSFIAGRGETGLTGNVYLGLLEYEDMAFVLHVLRGDNTFVDVGANVGAYSLLAGGAVGASVIAFEPVPATVARLREQVVINRLGSRGELFNAGVGSAPGELHFTNNQDTINRVVLSGAGPNTSRVAVTTLDEALSPVIAGGGRYVLKVDVEGFEYQVLAGAERTLAASGFLALVIELNGSGAAYGYSDRQIHDLLVGHGLTAVRYEPRSRRLSPLTGVNDAGGNTLYVRDLAAVAGLCATAPVRRVYAANGVEI
jgi:FkbM family methyltransferase